MKSYILSLTLIAAALFFSSTSYASPTLSMDSTGEDVVILQETLQELGYDITMIDGEFGNETKAAVESFQRDQNINVTGIVNNETWRALKKVQSDNVNVRSDNDYQAKHDTSFKEAPFGQILLTKSQADKLVRTAKDYIGVPYIFGGVTPSGFDCSGFLQYVFKENGIGIPRLADEQYNLGKSVNITELEAGDLVFFTTYEEGVSHCGIYLGERQFLHTSSSRGVRIDYLDNEYWSPRFFGAKKIVEV